MDTMLYLRMYDNFLKAHPFNEKIGVRKMQSYASGFPYKKAVKSVKEVAQIAAVQCKKACTMQVVSPYSKGWTVPAKIGALSAKAWYSKYEKIIKTFCTGKVGFYHLPTTKIEGWEQEYYWFIHNIYYFLHSAWYSEQSENSKVLWNKYLSDMQKKQQQQKKAYMERISKMSPEELLFESVLSAF